MSSRLVYRFGGGSADGSAELKPLLGGKGAGLAEMSALGLPVPPGFTITTEACRHYFDNGESWPESLWPEVEAGVAHVEALTGRKFGAPSNPLLFSVRSGAPVSMPGMMDTVLNLGLNDTTAQGLAAQSGNERFALDSYRRFISMFGDVVLGIHYTRFARTLDALRAGREESELSTEELGTLVAQLKDVVTEGYGAFPEDPLDQLRLSINAVFRSFNTPRARYYRKSQGIPEHTGTAVNVQAMVFGNSGPTSATGVCFTRDPKTGMRVFFGEWLPNAQGEDVVAGTHTPLPMDPEPARRRGAGEEGARPSPQAMPEVYDAELFALQARLEQHYKDMQDIEFTIEDGTSSTCCRPAPESAPPPPRCRSRSTWWPRGSSTSTRLIAHRARHRARDGAPAGARPRRPPQGHRPRASTPRPVPPRGRVVFHSDEAQELAERGEPVILVRNETSPEDIQGMTVSQGILTARGGQTSHAAVVARGMGKPCVVGCTEIAVDYAGSSSTPATPSSSAWTGSPSTAAPARSWRARCPPWRPPTDAGAMADAAGHWADEIARC